MRPILPSSFHRAYRALCLRGIAIALLAGMLFASGVRAADSYDIAYAAHFRPDQGVADVSITVSQQDGELEWLDFAIDPARQTGFVTEPGSALRQNGNRVRWDVARAGGRLTYTVTVNRERGGRFDARMTEAWAIMRLDHLFPPARVSTREREVSRPTLTLSGPENWRFETRYGAVRKPLELPPGERRFVRPTGWLAAGRLSIRRERIAGRRVAIAGPLGERLRSQDYLAMLQWNLPATVKLLPEFPDRLLIVMAGDPMWRGGLSGPGSTFVHAERPLISADGSSPPLHELMHVGTTQEARPGNDWIVEGLAEFYSIELMHRTGTTSTHRYRYTLDRISRAAEERAGRLASPSTGANTSRAVIVFRDLHQELKAAGHRTGLDVVATPLLQGPPISEARLLELAAAALGHPSRVLAEALATRGTQGSPSAAPVPGPTGAR